MTTKKNSPRAPIGVAIIAKDAAKTLGKCLASIRPYVEQVVVCVDERTTDRTAQVAKRGGAEVYPIKVSDWHECPQHGRVLAQHFAQARQESFTHLRRDLDFWLWIDSDDVLVGGDRLADLCAKLPKDAIGVWFQYEYASIETEHGQRQVNTLFNRERLLRTRLGERAVEWTWQGRVHETVSPSVQGRWLADVPEIRVVHQPGTHTTPLSALRNLLLLEIDYEDDPHSSRTVFYLGNQYFALGDWPQAIYWYETLHGLENTNPYELWQADLYRCLGYQRLGALEDARLAAYDALTAVPEHGEPYFQLAAICELEGQHEQCEFWNKLGTSMQRPPFFVFTNPLDYTFNWRMIQGQALLAQGRVTDARQTYEEAARIIRDPQVDERLADVRARERNMEQAQAFVNLAQSLNGKATEVYQALPDEVKAYGRTRDVVMPNILQGRTGSPRIVFWCGQGWEPWAPPSIDTTGIGGSETAVIEIAKRFATDGWTVDVFNGADRYEGVYDGVGYWDARRLNSLDEPEVLVSWRQTRTRPMAGRQNVLWCHDLNYGPIPEADLLTAWDKVLGVSAWHATMLERYYGVPADYVPNGVNLDRFATVIDAEGVTSIEKRPQKVPFRCVYASSPDRGLGTLLAIWPDIVKVEPTAELHVAYGWETIDRMIQSGRRPDLESFKEHIERVVAETPGVVWRGRLGQRDLAHLYGESVAWLYPTDFLEVSCISAMEALSGGAVPVTTACGALPETIGNAGLLVPGPTTSRPYRQTFLQVALGIICEKNNKLIYSQLGIERAKALTWDAAYSRWLSVLGLDGTPTADAPGASQKELVHA